MEEKPNSCSRYPQRDLFFTPWCRTLSATFHFGARYKRNTLNRVAKKSNLIAPEAVLFVTGERVMEEG